MGCGIQNNFIPLPEIKRTYMKKSKPYIIPDENKSIVQEPVISYMQGKPVEETYPVMSIKEALKTGMTLEESQRRLIEKVYKHFHS